MGKQLIPQLRFPEFEEDWQKSKLFQIISDFIVPMRDKPKDLTGNIPWCRIEDFDGIYLSASKSKQGVSLETVKLMNLKVYPIGTVLVSCSANLGFCAIVKEPLITNQTFIGLNPTDKVISEYLYYVMRNSARRLNVLSSGTTISYLSRKQFEKFTISLPQLPEQQKLASFFTDIDDKITKLIKKKTLLEKYKRGIMQKIFNQELRFKDDNGNEFPNWQKNKLGKSVKFLKGKGLPKSEIVDNGQYKCIHYGELFTKYNELIDNIISRTNDNDKTITSKVNDVLMPTSDVTPNGLATASCIKESDVILGGDVLIIRQDITKIEGVYLAYYIKHFRNDVMKLVSGSTVYHLYGSDLKNLQVLIPCLDEQIKIANFLTDIDLKITVLNTKIESNQTFKKGLLQKMFV